MQQDHGPAKSVARLLIDGMKSTGIRQLFCLPGVQNDDFFDALVDERDWLEVVVARHEQGAAYMALGAAQATGRPTAMCVVPGPGMLNAAAGLNSACGAGARVLAVVGQIATTQLGRGYRVLHELDDQPAILAQVTKHVGAVREPAHAAATIQSVLDQLVSGTPRAVALEVPSDLWAASASGELRAGRPTMPRPDPDAVSKAIALLKRAERPMIWVGSGAQDCSRAVRQLAEILQAPVSTRRMGHGVMDERDPLFVPFGLARELWRDRDVVLGIGSRIEFPLLHWGMDGISLIQINTDSDELDRHGIEAVGLHGDAGAVVPMLIDGLVGLPRGDARHELARRRQGFFAEIAYLEPQLSYLEAIREALPGDAVIVEDLTQVGFVAHFAYPFRNPRSFLSTGYPGTLGSGVAHAIGAKAALKDRPVVGIIGDGGFLFTAAELASAVQHGIAPVLIVFNDGAYGNVKRIQTERFGEERTIASTLVNPDFVKLAECFGCVGRRVHSPQELGTALRDAIGTDVPVVIEVPLGPVPNPWPHLRMGRVR